MPTKPFFIRMEKKRKHLQRSHDVSLLIRSTSEYAAFGSVLLALACGLYLEAAPPVPLLLFGLAGCFTLHAILLRYAQESPLVALSPPVAFVLLFWVTLYTGAASSPFIFLFILFILGGYLVKPLYGTLYLIATILGLLALYLAQSRGLWAADSSIPPQKEPLLAALVFGLFLVLVGGVFGKRLVQGLHNLYQSKESLERRAEEKEMLLKEVHHRVKNNLQTVSSLLRMQGRAIDDPHTLNQIRSSQNRVVCMAMVHEMLYMREDLSCIEYSTYVQQLADYLVKSVKGTETDIRLKIDVPEIELGIDTALPLGLLINEAVTNALKYGFAGRETGEISISLEKEDAHGYVLRIGDDGIGYPENMDYKASKSLGLKLIHNLSRQLRGSVIRDLSKRGTNYVIRFQEVQQDAFHSLA
jgi:two-component sensor histidine kinase